MNLSGCRAIEPFQSAAFHRLSQSDNVPFPPCDIGQKKFNSRISEIQSSLPRSRQTVDERRAVTP
jgi:hypothetical protein